jgi:malate dehydrogenase (oxaloacetate-decarboxylating)(NADP+)
MLTAAVTAYKEGICIPILLGNEEMIAKTAERNHLDLANIEIVNLRHDREADRRCKYAAILAEKRQRQGVTYAEAYEKMFDRSYFGMMMVECGDADAFITGTYTNYNEAIQIAKDVIGIRPEYKHFGAMHIVSTKKGTFYLADTLVNRKPDDETLVDIARLSVHTVNFFAQDPVMAMISYSNFGSDNQGSPAQVHSAVQKLHTQYPEIMVDGEMQLNFAMDKRLRDNTFPFSKLNGKDVNTLIFPNLSAANSAYKLLLEMGVNESVGPIQMGLNKPIHFTDIESSPRDVVNLTTVAVIDAIVDEKLHNK